MPSRILREGILKSDPIDLLDWPAEVFYRRLMSKVDDFGLFDARPSILRSDLYPLRVDRVREADIARWIAACETAGVIALYEHGGKPFGQMLKTEWQTRSEPKHPLPPWGKGEYLGTGENNREQVKTPVPVFGVVFGVGDVSPSGLFDVFWKAYPKKVGKDAARKAFEKREPTRALVEAMLAAIAEQVRSDAWQRDGGQFIPHPSTWLNAGRWQDEAVNLPQPKAVEVFKPEAPLTAEQLAANKVNATALLGKLKKSGLAGIREGAH